MPLGRIDSADVKVTTVRLDDSMAQVVAERADALGMSVSEFIRQCVALRLGALIAVESIRQGADVEVIGDFQRLTAALGEIARDGRR